MTQGQMIADEGLRGSMLALRIDSAISREVAKATREERWLTAMHSRLGENVCIACGRCSKLVWHRRCEDPEVALQYHRLFDCRP